MDSVCGLGQTLMSSGRAGFGDPLGERLRTLSPSFTLPTIRQGLVLKSRSPIQVYLVAAEFASHLYCG